MLPQNAYEGLLQSVAAFWHFPLTRTSTSAFSLPAFCSRSSMRAVNSAGVEAGVTTAEAGPPRPRECRARARRHSQSQLQPLPTPATVQGEAAAPGTLSSAATAAGMHAHMNKATTTSNGRLSHVDVAVDSVCMAAAVRLPLGGSTVWRPQGSRCTNRPQQRRQQPATMKIQSTPCTWARQPSYCGYHSAVAGEASCVRDSDRE